MSKKLLGPPPNRIRYFFASLPLALADVLMTIGMFIAGRENLRWQMLGTMADAGLVEIMSPEEYERRMKKDKDEDSKKETND